jgi:protein-disulfide isomerase
MFSQYEPNVKAAISYLKLLKVKVNNATVNESLQNHPDWPSLLCISDCLNKWNIPNAAGKIDVSKIDELPTPFIAYTSKRENQLSVVSGVSGKTVPSFHKNYNKTSTETKEDFEKNWDGVYLIAEPNEHSGEPNYEANKRKAFINALIPAAAFILIAILSFIFVNRMVTVNNSLLQFSAKGIYIQYFILFTGVFMTALLLWYEIDKSNPLLQKVCTGIAKGNCNAILTGKQAKVFSWLSWSEVGFFYFAGGLLTLLFAENSITVIAGLNVLALPYIVFSVYYQWRVAKQWCVLCLGVQALLLVGGINVIANNFLYPLPLFSFPFLFKSILLYLLPVIVWYAVKPSILKLQEAKNTKREYLRIKFNAEIFDTLLKKQKAITVSADGLGIDLGNPAATNTIIKVCNPYCVPCSIAHPKIEELLNQNDSVKAKIIFTTSTDDSDLNPAIKPTRHLMAIAAKENNKEIITQSLDDWCLAKTTNYEKFSKKYPMNGELLGQDEKIKAMKKWCEKMEIKFTPTIFINGYQRPDAYSIEDLQYFLLE